MPVHDWTRVEAGIFHHFHHAWIEENTRALNREEEIRRDPPCQRTPGGRRAGNRVAGQQGGPQPPDRVRSQGPGLVGGRRSPGTRGSLPADRTRSGGDSPDRLGDDDNDTFQFDATKPLTCASYIGGLGAEAFVEPVAVGDKLPTIPLFLTPEEYVPVPLEATYQSAFDSVPEIWREALMSPEI